MIRLPDPCLVILVGPAGSGKSTWAKRHLPAGCVVSSDELRATLGHDITDQRASGDAFAVLYDIVERRLKRALLTCVDSTGLSAEDRTRWTAMAHAAGLTSHVIVFTVDARTAIARVERRGRPVPRKVVTGMVERMEAVIDAITTEPHDSVHDATAAGDDVALVPAAVWRRPDTDAPPDGSHTGTDRQGAVGIDVLVGGPPPDLEVLDIVGWYVGIARAAEDAGVAGLWLTDHLLQIPQAGRPWEPVVDPYVMLSHLAGETRRLRLGVAVSPPTFRHPAVLAKQLATLDVISRGRARCGLGLGWFAAEHGPLGIALPPPAQRAVALADTIGALRALWGPGTKPWTGGTIALADTTSYPRPLQERLPIMVGGDGPSLTLPLAGRLADAVNLKGPVESLAAKISIVREAARAADRDPDEIEITHRTHIESDVDRLDPADLVPHVRALGEVGVSTAVLGVGRPSPTTMAGFSHLVEHLGEPPLW